MKTAVGYFSNCAIDHEEAAAFERATGSYPTRRETLNCYLETLTMALEELGGGHPHDPFPSEYDSSSRPTRRYRYFEVPWAKPTVQDLLAAIAEVRELIRSTDREADGFGDAAGDAADRSAKECLKRPLAA